MRAVIFISRNKDNKHLPNYKQRKETFTNMSGEYSYVSNDEVKTINFSFKYEID